MYALPVWRQRVASSRAEGSLGKENADRIPPPAICPRAPVRLPAGDMNQASSPQALEGLALQGSRDAWGALAERHGHAVVVALVARGLAVDRAKDLAQAA